jgi:hypothetical protein
MGGLKGGLKSTKTLALFLDKEGYAHVRALYACRLRQSIRIYREVACPIFSALGRDGEWDMKLGLRNPAADKVVRDYLRSVTADQLKARVTPKQATPFLIDKLDRLALHLNRLAEVTTISPSQRFLIARDQVYFKAVFFSGDRPGDVSLVQVPEILRFPNDDGLPLNHVWGR